MDDDPRNDREPPVSPDENELARLVAASAAADADHAAWSDERFIQWLADEQHATPAELSRAGQRLIVRAYCRKFGIQLLKAPPVTTEVSGGENYAPLIELTSFTDRDAVDGTDRVIIPETCAASSCIACAVTEPVECFAPFITVGDTLLIARASPETHPAVVVCRVDGRPRVIERTDSGDVLGTLVALWSVAIS